MRPKLLLLALCLCALGVMLGQNEPALVGMPEVGVTLTGSAEHPEIVNNSGRTILGYVLWQRDANGGGMLPLPAPTILTDKLRRSNIPAPTGPFAVAPQVTSHGSGTPAPPMVSNTPSVGPPIEVALTQRFNWFTVIVWTALILFIIGLGVWQMAGIIEGQAREIARLRREIELLERAIDQELARTIPKGS